MKTTGAIAYALIGAALAALVWWGRGWLASIGIVGVFAQAYLALSLYFLVIAALWVYAAAVSNERVSIHKEPPEGPPARNHRENIEQRWKRIDEAAKRARKSKRTHWHQRALLLLACAPALALAQTPESTIRAALQKQLAPNAKINTITAAPMPGWYAVQVGADWVYVDASGRYALLGPLTDLSTGENLTEAKQTAQAVKTVWSQSSLRSAIKTVKGNGRRQLVVFDDPTCAYCKKLRRELDKLSDVTIYTFLLPILSEESKSLARDIWCAQDPGTAHNEWMLNAKSPTAVLGACQSPDRDVMALASTLKVQGTPVVFFADGTRADGSISDVQLRKRIAGAR